MYMCMYIYIYIYIYTHEQTANYQPSHNSRQWQTALWHARALVSFRCPNHCRSWIRARYMLSAMFTRCMFKCALRRIARTSACFTVSSHNCSFPNFRLRVSTPGAIAYFHFKVPFKSLIPHRVSKTIQTWTLENQPLLLGAQPAGEAATWDLRTARSSTGDIFIRGPPHLTDIRVLHFWRQSEGPARTCEGRWLWARSWNPYDTSWQQTNGSEYPLSIAAAFLGPQSLTQYTWRYQYIFVVKYLVDIVCVVHI